MIEYLTRIGLEQRPGKSIEGLNKIHRAHLFNVPFENLDVHEKEKIDLDLEKLKNKVITRSRGGFCYELNYLFCHLLQELGFNSRTISARIFDESNKLGPEFEEMLKVLMKGQWLEHT